MSTTNMSHHQTLRERVADFLEVPLEPLRNLDKVETETLRILKSISSQLERRSTPSPLNPVRFTDDINEIGDRIDLYTEKCKKYRSSLNPFKDAVTIMVLAYTGEDDKLDSYFGFYTAKQLISDFPKLLDTLLKDIMEDKHFYTKEGVRIGMLEDPSEYEKNYRRFSETTSIAEQGVADLKLDIRQGDLSYFNSAQSALGSIAKSYLHLAREVNELKQRFEKIVLPHYEKNPGRS